MLVRTRPLIAAMLGLMVLAACVQQQVDPPVTEYGLTVDLAGSGAGTVVSVPAGIDTATDDLTAAFASGTVVTLTATADAGSEFVGFTPADVCEDGSTATTCVVTMNAAVAVTATFDLEETPPPSDTRTLTVEIVGEGAVASEPEGIATAEDVFAFAFEEGTEVTLTATPAAGWVLVNFVVEDGACGPDSGALTCDVTMDADQQVTVTFAAIPIVTLSVELLGNGTGHVQSAPPGINSSLGATNADFFVNTVVTLTATPLGGSEFTGWSGDACDGSLALTCVVAMNASKRVHATFTAGQDLTVNVVRGGTAAGSVVSVPAGIDVSEVEGSQTVPFPLGTVVLLTATVDAGAFAGWTGGDCDGLKTLVCTVTVDVGEPPVTANFNEVAQLTLTGAAFGDDAVEFLADSISFAVNNPEGWVWANANRLFLNHDPDHANVEAGFRFPAVTVPAGANVLSAVLQLTADTAASAADIGLTLRGQAAANPAGFPQDPDADPSFNLTQRQRTAASVAWNITGAWVANDNYTAPNAATVLQEIIGLPGWASGNAVVLLLEADGSQANRLVWTFEGATAAGELGRRPTLLIDYVPLP